MLNKQTNDPDVAGTGQFVEENFFNIGIGDHPVQALNAQARGHLDPTILGRDGFPYHAEDVGRQEITHNSKDAFRFRTLTLRQLKDARTFFHSGSFKDLRALVEYFNAGIPQDPTAGAASTLSTRFTNPRGPGYPNGLGFSKQQVRDLTEFLEFALYDPAFAHYDPQSTTDSFQPNERDLTYSKYRPDLAALGAQDGVMLSGKAIDDDDPLARRDEGLEFLDVTRQISTQFQKSVSGGDEVVTYQLTNSSPWPVDTHLLIIVSGLKPGVRMENASGITSHGEPYRRVFLPDGVLHPGQTIERKLIFERKPGNPELSYTLTFFSGQGNP